MISAAAPDPSWYCVLVVDDDDTVRLLISGVLEDAGYRVVTARDGVEALEAWSSQHVDCIVTDVNMPNMNGLELIGKLRGLATYKFTPILVLTTEMDPNKKQQAKASGATGWIVKPFDPDTLLATIRKVIG